ncbi:MAG: hypothetical protein P0S95_03970 [Rhabdochlamydiaceae bacterium]|nr:hypothetical protein [Candidatus Amphrikana amoebophyrae]
MSISFCDLLKSTRKDDAHLLRLVFRQALKASEDALAAANLFRLAYFSVCNGTNDSAPGAGTA